MLVINFIAYGPHDYQITSPGILRQILYLPSLRTLLGNNDVTNISCGKSSTWEGCSKVDLSFPYSRRQQSYFKGICWRAHCSGRFGCNVLFSWPQTDAPRSRAENKRKEAPQSIEEFNIQCLFYMRYGFGLKSVWLNLLLISHLFWISSLAWQTVYIPSGEKTGGFIQKSARAS